MKRINYKGTSGATRNVLKMADEGMMTLRYFMWAVGDLFEGDHSHGVIGAIVNVPVETLKSNYFWGHMVCFWAVWELGYFVYGLI